MALVMVAAGMASELSRREHGPVDWMSYATYAVIGTLLGLAAYVASRFLLPREEIARGAMLLVLISLPLFDPYTFGRSGGDEMIHAAFRWQAYATGTLVVFLVIAVALLGRGRRRAAIVLLTVEVCAFLSINAAYISRDGFFLRSHIGYWGSPLPLVTLIAGIGLRSVVLFGLAGVTTAPLRADRVHNIAESR